MSNQTSVKAVVSGNGARRNQITPLRMSLVNDDGSPMDLPTAAEPVADSTATDIAGLVADFNELLASLRAAGTLKTS